jgi:hypothetical protein
MPVHVFGFPQAVIEGRWTATTYVTAVGKNGFQLQNLSAPGLSGGAVIATNMGKIIGYIHGAQDAEEEGTVQRFGSYAFNVANLPERPSSRRSSPSK